MSAIDVTRTCDTRLLAAAYTRAALAFGDEWAKMPHDERELAARMILEDRYPLVGIRAARKDTAAPVVLGVRLPDRRFRMANPSAADY